MGFKGLSLRSTKPRLLFIAPTPPPFAGPEVVSAALLNSDELHSQYEVKHLKSNVNDNNSDKGKFSIKVLLRFGIIFLKFLNALFRFKPDAIYTLLAQNKIGFLRDSIYIFLSSLIGAKVICQFHGEGFNRFYKNRRRYFQYIIARTISKVDLLLVQGENLKNQFFGFLAYDKLRVVPNGINVREFNLQKDYSPSDKVKVLFLSSLFPSKGFVDVYEVAKSLTKENKELKFIFAGELCGKDRNILYDGQGRRLPALKDLSSLNNGDSVKYVGPVYGRAKVKLMFDADIFVLPSYSESFPTVVLEAMAAGLPLIVTPVGALTEIIKDGENCRFIASGDRKALRKRILELAGDVDLRERMGKANRWLVESEFTIEKMQESFVEVLEEQFHHYADEVYGKSKIRIN